MRNLKNQKIKDPMRRQRQHELLIALIQQQENLELLDSEGSSFDCNSSHSKEPALWIERNRRIMSKYQALVSSAITLDALLDSGGIQSD